jgi:Thaumatin family
MGSCYTQGAGPTCCGCADWADLGLKIPPPPDTDRCISKNPAWVDRVQNTLFWLKKGCPTAYTYPYDDMSSTFVCKNMVNQMNLVNYQITFCPQNEVKASHNYSAVLE